MIDIPSIKVRKQDSNHYLLEGQIDEHFDASWAEQFTEDNIFLSFKEISNINSTGILNFIKFLSKLKPSQRVIYTEVGSLVVAQMSMVKGFISTRFHLESFYVPYCSKDSNDQTLMRLTFDEVKSGRLPPKKHPETGALMEADVNEKKFLNFLNFVSFSKMNQEYLDQVTDSCFILNEDDHVLFFNQAAANLLGIKPSLIKRAGNFSNLMTFEPAIPEDRFAEIAFVVLPTDTKGVALAKRVRVDPAQSLIVLKDLTVETMLHQKHQDHLAKLKEANKHLELTVANRTAELRKVNKYLNDILHSFNQAIFTVDKEGRIDRVNALNMQILSPGEIPETFTGLLSDVPQKEISVWLELLFQLKLRFEDMASFGPQNLVYNGRFFALTYTPLMDPSGSVLEALIVAATDKTEEKVITDSLSAKKEHEQSLALMTKHSSIYSLVFEECSQLLESAIEEASEEKELRQTLHALKGLFSAFGPIGFDKKIHALEVQSFNPVKLLPQLSALRDEYLQSMESLFNTLPHLKSHVKILDLDIIRQLFDARSIEEIRRPLLKLLSLDLTNFLLTFEAYARDTGQEHDKPLKAFTISGAGLLLKREVIPCLNLFIIHGIRNSISHVFEYAKDARTNSIALRIQEGPDSVQVTIETAGRLKSTSDPGTGILSGQKQGLNLVERAARKIGARVELLLDKEADRSFYTIHIPQKYKNSSEAL